MTGETELQILLSHLNPILQPATYVFCTLPDSDYGVLAYLSPLGCFQENEGLTLILDQEKAEIAGLEYQDVFRCISLSVHSSLNAVGLTAAVSAALASNGICANMVAAYFHDHVFVPEDRADDALRLLKRFSASS